MNEFYGIVNKVSSKKSWPMACYGGEWMNYDWQQTKITTGPKNKPEDGLWVSEILSPTKHIASADDIVRQYRHDFLGDAPKIEEALTMQAHGLEVHTLDEQAHNTFLDYLEQSELKNMMWKRAGIPSGDNEIEVLCYQPPESIGSKNLEVGDKTFKLSFEAL